MWTLTTASGQISYSKNDSNYLDVKLNVSMIDGNKKFRLVKILTMGEAGSKQLMPLRTQLANAAKNFGGDENLSPVLMPIVFEDMDEHFQLAH